MREIHAEEISRTINGSKITRKGNEENKALVIEQEDGTTVLKLQSEVERDNQ